jgi:YggT family protein
MLAVLILASTRTQIATYVNALFVVYSILIVVYVLTSMIFSLGVKVPYNRIVNAILEFLKDVSEPFLRIFRSFIPMIGPLDLSPIAALLTLNIVGAIVVSLIHG